MKVAVIQDRCVHPGAVVTSEPACSACSWGSAAPGTAGRMHCRLPSAVSTYFWHYSAMKNERIIIGFPCALCVFFVSLQSGCCAKCNSLIRVLWRGLWFNRKFLNRTFLHSYCMVPWAICQDKTALVGTMVKLIWRWWSAEESILSSSSSCHLLYPADLFGHFIYFTYSLI